MCILKTGWKCLVPSESLLREEKKFQVEFRFRKKDGNYIYAENYGVWLKDDRGKVYRAIGVIKNITEWKLAIEKVEESEKKYRSFIQNFHGIAFQADENFVPVFLHGAVKEITGYSEKEFMSRIKWKDIIHPDDLSFVLKEEEKIRSSLIRRLRRNRISYKAQGWKNQMG